MLSTLAEFSPYLSYAAPPLVGAFIGYLTNRIAIRMLFRPLKQWRVGPLRVPMTPGVIPSRRHLLAENIGEMVGEHLLTGDEITRALVKDRFQSHLQSLIETRVGSYLKLDLGSFNSIVPSGYRAYFDIGCKTLIYRIKETVHAQMVSESFEQGVEAAIAKWFDSFLEKPIGEVISPDLARKLSTSLEDTAAAMLIDPALEAWLDDFMADEIRSLADNNISLGDLVPAEVQEQLINGVCAQTPELLKKAAALFKEPEVREALVAVIVKAIDNFIDTLGPMSAMVRNFLTMDLIEQKVRDFLGAREDQIAAFLLNEDITIRVSAALRERSAVFFKTRLGDLVEKVPAETVRRISSQSAGLIRKLLGRKEVARALSRFISAYLDEQIEHGSAPVSQVITQIGGIESPDKLRAGFQREAVAIIRSPMSRQLVDSMIDRLAERLINCPIGRLDHIVPAGVKDGVYRSLREMTTAMLISEVPGIVKSINFKKIVTDRIDSFDLLRVEGLLLSIMQEQFKYINLFGALLGFIIGCANLIFIVAQN